MTMRWNIFFILILVPISFLVIFVNVRIKNASTIRGRIRRIRIRTRIRFRIGIFLIICCCAFVFLVLLLVFFWIQLDIYSIIFIIIFNTNCLITLDGILPSHRLFWSSRPVSSTLLRFSSCQDCFLDRLRLCYSQCDS